MAKRGVAHYDREQLEELYAPSRWSKRLSADVIVDEHIRVFTEGTQLARSTLKCDLNVVYDPESGQTLDIYYPNEVKADSPLLIYIHGGYWQELGIEHSGYLAPTFAKHGIVTVAIGYDLAPKASMTTIVEQCRKGCAYIAQKFQGRRVDIIRVGKRDIIEAYLLPLETLTWIFISGHSAGAHLSACVMTTTDWAPSYGLHQTKPFAGAFLISGIYDLTPIKLTHVNDPLNLTDQEVEEFSPQNTLDKIPAPLKQDFSCLVAVGDQESPEFIRQSKEYLEGLKAAGVSCSFQEVPNEDHFSVAERLIESEYSLTKMMSSIINSVA